MKGTLLSLSLLASAAVSTLGANLDIDVTLPIECDRRTQKGDKVKVHYRGTLQSNGQKFDASYDRGSPFSFTLGKGQVIKGWDQGLLDMCIGEKRTLTVPPEYGYGQRGMGPIPAGSTLVFETEMMAIAGVPNPEPASTAGIAEKVGSKVADAAGIVKTVLADSDDGQEHNEL